MRRNLNFISLNRQEVELVLGCSSDFIRAFGCEAVKRVVMESSANADVELIEYYFADRGISVDEVDLLRIRDFVGDRYVTVATDEESRAALLDIFRYQETDDVIESALDYDSRQIERRIASLALQELS